MTDFSQQIASFTDYGIYQYQFDNVGNVILNPSSSTFQQVYFSLPFGNFTYNNSKILSFYNPTFTEFIPTTPTSSSAALFPQEAIDQINDITNQNQQLQNQLTSFIAASQVDTGSADVQSVKNTIINLRISLGQGITESDFQDVYPYLPNTLETSNPQAS